MSEHNPMDNNNMETKMFAQPNLMHTVPTHKVKIFYCNG